MLIASTLLYISCLDQIGAFLSPRGGTEDGSEEWGYVPLRPNASMFYWFYKTTHPDGHRNRPIILWLQGGPGASGIGVGNFLEIGPLDQNMKPRNSTWIQTANVLFVDNPVGVGFSIADYNSIPKNIEEISDDQISVLKTFMDEHSYFQKNPLYIFGQSYGGKIATILTADLHKAKQKNEIQCNLKGVGIGNGFVSPMDAIGHCTSIVYEMSLIDDVLYRELRDRVQNGYQAAEESRWDIVHDAYFGIMSQLYANVPNFNIYKMTDITIPAENWGLVYDTVIDEFMNDKVKETLGIIPDDKKWSFWYEDAYNAQYESYDALEPAWPVVDEILKTSGVDVIVYSGQLDVICNTVGTLSWIQRLTSPGLYISRFNRAWVHKDLKVRNCLI